MTHNDSFFPEMVGDGILTSLLTKYSIKSLMELKYVANHGIVEQTELDFSCCVYELIIKLFTFGRTILPNEYHKYNEYINNTANNDRKYIYRSSQP